MGVEFPGGLLMREEYDAIVRELPLLGLKEKVKDLLVDCVSISRRLLMIIL